MVGWDRAAVCACAMSLHRAPRTAPKGWGSAKPITAILFSQVQLRRKPAGTPTSSRSWGEHCVRASIFHAQFHPPRNLSIPDTEGLKYSAVYSPLTMLKSTRTGASLALRGEESRRRMFLDRPGQLKANFCANCQLNHLPNSLLTAQSSRYHPPREKTPAPRRHTATAGSSSSENAKKSCYRARKAPKAWCNMPCTFYS